MSQSPNHGRRPDRGLSDFCTVEDGIEVLVIYSPENSKAWIQSSEYVSLSPEEPGEEPDETPE